MTSTVGVPLIWVMSASLIGTRQRVPGDRLRPRLVRARRDARRDVGDAECRRHRDELLVCQAVTALLRLVLVEGLEVVERGIRPGLRDAGERRSRAARIRSAVRRGVEERQRVQPERDAPVRRGDASVAPFVSSNSWQYGHSGSKYTSTVFGPDPTWM